MTNQIKCTVFFTKDSMMDDIIGIAALLKNPKNKRKYKLKQARESYIKIRELLE